MQPAENVPAETPEQVFARRMREVRESRNGMPQTVLALVMTMHGTKVDSTAITRMEKGTRAIRLNEAVTAARVLHVPLMELLQPAPSGSEALGRAKQAWTEAAVDAGRTRDALRAAEAAETAARERYRQLQAEAGDQEEESVELVLGPEAILQVDIASASPAAPAQGDKEAGDGEHQ